MLTIKSCFGCLIIGSLLLSCKKSSTYTHKGEVDVKFFTNNLGSGNAPGNSISYNVVNIPDAAGSGLLNLSTNIATAIKFAVFATKPVSQDVTITATLDNSLVAKYNAANGTNYAAFPAGILKTDGLVAHMTNGATASSDSIAIQTDLATINSLTEKAYMAPIKLATVSNPGAGVIATNSTGEVVYIIANIELRRIKYLATAAEAIGALITPRTSWTVALTPTPTTTGSIVDGSTSTFARWGTSPGILDVNLQATRNLTGIRLYTSNNATHIPTQVDVLLSNDGINYDIIGSPLRANLTYASSYHYILFYKAIAAKYIRLRLFYTTSTNTQNTRVTEIDVYAN